MERYEFLGVFYPSHELALLSFQRRFQMFKLAIVVASTSRFVDSGLRGRFPSAAMSSSLPHEAMTVTDWYKQNVYDPNAIRSEKSWTFSSTSPGKSPRSLSA
jgi:hypothetical protein